MWYANDMFRYMFKAEFVTLVSFKSPVGEVEVQFCKAIFASTYGSKTLSFADSDSMDLAIKGSPLTYWYSTLYSRPMKRELSVTFSDDDVCHPADLVLLVLQQRLQGRHHHLKTSLQVSIVAIFSWCKITKNVSCMYCLHEVRVVVPLQVEPGGAVEDDPAAAPVAFREHHDEPVFKLSGGRGRIKLYSSFPHFLFALNSTFPPFFLKVTTKKKTKKNITSSAAIGSAGSVSMNHSGFSQRMRRYPRSTDIDRPTSNFWDRRNLIDGTQ